MGRWLKKIKNKQYGQAMVEFALTLPVFLIAIIGIIELSRFFLVYSSVYTASREAARFGSAVGDINDTNYQDCDGIKQVAVDTGWFGGVNASNVDVYYESSPGETPVACPANVPLGYRLVVETQADYEPLLIGLILPDGITVSARNGRTIMKQIEMVATPIPPAICADDLKFEGVLDIPSTSQKSTLKINISNTSPYSTYQIISLSNLRWQDDIDPSKRRKLTQVYWNDTLIWNDSEGYETPIEISTSDWGASLRNLPAGQIFELRFEFDKNIDTQKGTVHFTLNFESTRTKLDESGNVIPQSVCSLNW